MTLCLTQHARDGLSGVVFCAGRPGLCRRKDFTKGLLIIIGVAVEGLIDALDSLYGNLFAIGLELAVHEVGIFVQGDDVQMHDVGTVIERTGRIEKHLLHQMPFAAREYELCIGRLLYIGTQQCLYIPLVVCGYLLEFVNHDDTTLLSLFQRSENFLKRVYWILNVAHRNAKGGQPRQVVYCNFAR